MLGPRLAGEWSGSAAADRAQTSPATAHLITLHYMYGPIPEDIEQILDRIRDGELADDLESDTLDFKEDPVVLAQELRESLGYNNGNPASKLHELLVDASLCFANSTSGESLVVLGVADKIGGPAAFTGTTAVVANVENVIFDHTDPGLRVEATACDYHGTRLLLIRVPESHTVHTNTDGHASHRVGSACLQLSPVEVAALRTFRSKHTR